jgi:hypothetical protein
MPNVVTINSIAGTPPYDAYICDNPISECIYIGRFNFIPYEFDVPKIMINFTEFNLKIVDSDGCEVTTILTI